MLLLDVLLAFSAPTFTGLKKKKHLKNLVSRKIEQIELMPLVKTMDIDIRVKFCVKSFMGFKHLSVVDQRSLKSSCNGNYLNPCPKSWLYFQCSIKEKSFHSLVAVNMKTADQTQTK